MAHKYPGRGDQVYDTSRNSWVTGKVRHVDYTAREVHVIYPKGGMEVDYETYPLDDFMDKWTTTNRHYVGGVYEI